MKAYDFVTVWRVGASREAVWNEIHPPEKWPHWWKGVVSVVALREGDAAGVGSVRRYTWQGRLPYRITFDMEVVRVEPPALLEGRASGELEGRGLWRLSEQEDETLVRYDWNVQTAKPWMRWLAPVARPIFKWNHDAVMSWGPRGLAGGWMRKSSSRPSIEPTVVHGRLRRLGGRLSLGMALAGPRVPNRATTG